MYGTLFQGRPHKEELFRWVALYVDHINGRKHYNDERDTHIVSKPFHSMDRKTIRALCSLVLSLEDKFPKPKSR